MDEARMNANLGANRLRTIAIVCYGRCVEQWTIHMCFQRTWWLCEAGFVFLVKIVKLVENVFVSFDE